MRTSQTNQMTHHSATAKQTTLHPRYKQKRNRCQRQRLQQRQHQQRFKTHRSPKEHPLKMNGTITISKVVRKHCLDNFGFISDPTSSLRYNIQHSLLQMPADTSLDASKTFPSTTCVPSWNHHPIFASFSGWEPNTALNAADLHPTVPPPSNASPVQPTSKHGFKTTLSPCQASFQNSTYLLLGSHHQTKPACMIFKQWPLRNVTAKHTARQPPTTDQSNSTSPINNISCSARSDNAKTSLSCLRTRTWVRQCWNDPPTSNAPLPITSLIATSTVNCPSPQHLLPLPPPEPHSSHSSNNTVTNSPPPNPPTSSAASLWTTTSHSFTYSHKFTRVRGQPDLPLAVAGVSTTFSQNGSIINFHNFST